MNPRDGNPGGFIFAAGLAPFFLGPIGIWQTPSPASLTPRIDFKTFPVETHYHLIYNYL